MTTKRRWRRHLHELIAREPVVLGGAIMLTLEAAAPTMSLAWKAATASWVTFAQRSLSTPKASAERKAVEAHESGYNAAVAEVSALDT